MEYIDRTNKADRIHGAIGVTIEIFYDFEDATPAKSPQGLGGRRFPAALGFIDRVAEAHPNFARKRSQVLPTRADKET